MVTGIFNVSYVNTSEFRSDRCRKPCKSFFCYKPVDDRPGVELRVFPWYVCEKSKQRSLQNSVLLEHICLHATAKLFLLYRCHSDICMVGVGGGELIFKTHSAMQVWNRKQTSVDTKNWFTHLSWLLQVQRLSHWVSAFSRFENKSFKSVDAHDTIHHSQWLLGTLILEIQPGFPSWMIFSLLLVNILSS